MTAPHDPLETEDRETSPLTSGINHPSEDQAIDTNAPVVDEILEERFNTINADGAVAVGIPNLETTEPTKPSFPEFAGTMMTEEEEEVVDVEGEDLDSDVVATREALTDSAVGRNVTGDVDDGQLESVAIAAEVKSAGNLLINNNSPTREASIPNGNSVETEATCDAAFNSDGSHDILGDHATVEEILEELEQSEIPKPPNFIVEPEPDLYIVPAKDLQLHCQASETAVIG